MSILLQAFLIGMVMNSIRGGNMTARVPVLSVIGKHLNDVVFGLFCVYARNGELDITTWGYDAWREAAWYMTAMWAGRSLGWGEYIGAMVHNYIKTGREVPQIDSVLKNYLDRPVLWGFLGLTLRGALWGLMLALALHSLLPLLAGACMGTVYLAVIKLADLRDGKLDTIGAPAGWGFSEMLFGGILWVGCAYVS